MSTHRYYSHAEIERFEMHAIREKITTPGSKPGADHSFCTTDLRESKKSPTQLRNLNRRCGSSSHAHTSEKTRQHNFGEPVVDPTAHRGLSTGLEATRPDRQGTPTTTTLSVSNREKTEWCVSFHQDMIEE